MFVCLFVSQPPTPPPRPQDKTFSPEKTFSPSESTSSNSEDDSFDVSTVEAQINIRQGRLIRHSSFYCGTF